MIPDPARRTVRQGVILLGMIFIFPLLSAQETGIYTLYLKDKKGSPYSLDHPEDFLSQRALSRRAREGVAVTYADLPVSPQYLSALDKAGFHIRCTSRWFNSVTVDIDDPSLFDTLLRFTFMEGMRLVRPYGKGGGQAVEKWHETLVAGTAGASLPQLGMMRGDELHALGYRAKDVIIAVLDAGFYHADQLPAFDSLFAGGRLLGTRDIVDGNGNVFDDHPHGMYVLSILAGIIPGGLTGSAPDARYWLIRTEDADSEYPVEEEYWIAGAELADSAGADILSSSLGYFTFDQARFNHTYADLDGRTTPVARAALMAARRGIIVVASAGNEGNKPWHYIITPADADSLLAVGAVDVNGLPASFSSYGPAADGRIKPDVAALGVNVVIQNSSGSLSRGSGTSFSAPLVAGMMACLRQAFPTLTAISLITTLRQQAGLSDHPDNRLGYGIPDVMKTFEELSLMQKTEEHPGTLLLYPNPVRDKIRFSFLLQEKGPAVLHVTDLSGRDVLKIPFELHGGYNTGLIDIQQLAAGTYLLLLHTPSHTLIGKILKIK